VWPVKIIETLIITMSLSDAGPRTEEDSETAKWTRMMMKMEGK